MKKDRSIIMFGICLIVLSIGLTEYASDKFKDNIKNNYETTESNKPVTSSIPKESTNVIQTKENESQLKGDKEITNYSNYLKKIWIVDSENYILYDYCSFFITKIENGKLEGKFSTASVAWPDFFVYSFNPSKYLGNLTGKVNNDSAECQFADRVGNEGKITLTFKLI